jgi:hypothetical protein
MCRCCELWELHVRRWLHHRHQVRVRRSKSFIVELEYLMCSFVRARCVQMPEQLCARARILWPHTTYSTM